VVARTWRYAAGLALLGALAGGLVGCTSGPAGSGSTVVPTGGATSVPATSTATSSVKWDGDGVSDGDVGVSGGRAGRGSGELPGGGDGVCAVLLRPGEQGLHHPPGWSACPRCQRRTARHVRHSRRTQAGLSSSRANWYDRRCAVQSSRFRSTPNPGTGGHTIDVVAHQQPAKGDQRRRGATTEDIKDVKVIFVSTS
jgi:hypothetical protein